MKILVTGGAGFIGSNLVRFLLEKTQHQVVNLDKLTYAGNLDSLCDLEGHPRYCFEQACIAEPQTVQALFERHAPDAVMHLAAESHVDRSIDGPGEFIQTNIIGTYNLLQASLQYWRSLAADNEQCSMLNTQGSSIPHPPSCIPRQASTIKHQASSIKLPSSIIHRSSSKQSFRFLHVSTDEVFGSLTSTDPGFTETTPYSPRSPYSASKAASDHLARAWHHTYGLPVLVTNCSNNYGPYQFPEKLIPVVILKALDGDPIPVYGKGENIRDWLFVEDHCEALVRVLESGTPGETYNVGGNNELRNIDLVRTLCEILDELSPRADAQTYANQITFVTDRPGHDLRYAINATKIRTELGWSPRESATTGFRKTVQWYLNHESWWRKILSGDYKLERLGTGGARRPNA